MHAKSLAYNAILKFPPCIMLKVAPIILNSLQLLSLLRMVGTSVDESSV